ncbi:MAG TPA: aldehyde ferredoxin oxidoreductase family protein [Candidatus Baltobacteraceae bacterium]|nr:aldehyde ferredoxin oxidoreductase family protein [Candidatus Baltobacteraceae bacterium]
MQGAFNGKLLRVNLTEGTTATEDVPVLVSRMYLGGAAMAVYLLHRELKPGVDPLGPDNVLVFTACPTNGSPISGTSRFTAAAKSPLTGGYGEGEAGGWWGPELKFAGFDGIIITGQSPKPVYLWICDGKAELRDAAHLWGKISGEVQELITAETDKRARVLQCGIAGERGVRMANLVNELKHFNGRTGLGAVMGSKKLRAIAIRGHGKLEPKNPDGVKAVLQWFKENYKRETDTLHKLGTSRGVLVLNTDGMLPTRNFQEGQFEHAAEISGQKMAETILEDEGTCFACAVACKREVSIPEMGVTPEYGGPEYETVGSSGSVCGVGDLKAIAKFNQICGEYVMDTISVGMTIAFAMDCFTNGILTTADTDGLELTFGNAEALLALAEKIGKREGFGDVLADGAKRAAARFGKGAERLVLTVKGQELPLHDPRGKQGLSLAYATAPGGADHVRAPHDPVYEGFHPDGAHPLEPLGLCEAVARRELSPRKVRAYYYAQHWWGLCSSAGICTLAAAPVSLLSITQMVNLIRAITGWDTSLWELLKVAERGAALARAFNCREGFTPKDDRLPDRLHEALTSGPLKDVRVDRDSFARAVRLYHQMEGWDPETGWPTFAKLAELGIEWAAKPGDSW